MNNMYTYLKQTWNCSHYAMLTDYQMKKMGDVSDTHILLNGTIPIVTNSVTPYASLYSSRCSKD